jgi:hypothetical protein
MSRKFLKRRALTIIGGDAAYFVELLLEKQAKNTCGGLTSPWQDASAL